MYFGLATGRPYYYSPTTFGIPYRDLMLMYTEVSSVAEPITLAEAKDHLGIDDDRDNAQITSLIAEARLYCERHIYRTIRQQVVRQVTMREWPASGRIALEYPPLVSVDSVSYLDQDEAVQVVDSDQYRFITSDVARGHLQFIDTFAFPNLAIADNAVTVVYTAGYATQAAIPADLKAAVKLSMDILWDHDEDPRLMATYEARRDAILDANDPGVYA